MSLVEEVIPSESLALLRRGAVIPAHPLALDADRRLDERRQRALSRYYLDAGAGGLAVGVHATQFAIRDCGLYEPVLRLAAEETQRWAMRPTIMIAGLAGPTSQALAEATTARRLGYHAGLLSLLALGSSDEADLLAHCRTVAGQIPLIGFYLQQAVGGRRLSADFWRQFAEIENVVAIKVAPFDRYRTLEVLRGVVAARAEEKVTLYTGNDDHIVLDLATPFTLRRNGEEVTLRFRGGLLGHWSVWTRRAVELLKAIQGALAAGHVPQSLLAKDSQVTDANSAFFDAANNFAGCIAGCHEVLRRQGLLSGIWCLDPRETMSPGQSAEIDRIYKSYPELNDDEFVRTNLTRWLAI